MLSKGVVLSLCLTLKKNCHSSYYIMNNALLSYLRVKEVIGYDPEILLDEQINVTDFFHPADQPMMQTMRSCSKRLLSVCSVLYYVIPFVGQWDFNSN